MKQKYIGMAFGKLGKGCPFGREFHFALREDGQYVLLEKMVYYSPRYGKTITCESGFVSDGATGAEDLVSEGWWIHDKARKTRQWDDGSPCDAWQSSLVLHDILRAEGRWFRAKTWGLATYLHGRFREWRGDYTGPDSPGRI